MLPGVQRMQQPGKESHDSGWQRLATGDGARQRKCRQSATRVMGGKEGDGGKSDGDGKKGGGRAPAMATATKRAMVRAASVADKEGYVQGGESDCDGDGKDDGDGEGKGKGDGNGKGNGKGNGDGGSDGEGVKSNRRQG